MGKEFKQIPIIILSILGFHLNYQDIAFSGYV